MGELSTTESAFLERSRRQGLEGNRSSSISGSKGDALLASHFEQGFRGGTRGVGGGGEYDSWGPGHDGAGGGSGGAATISALRDRLAGAEAENKALLSRSRRAEEELTAEAAQADKARKKLAQVTC